MNPRTYDAVLFDLDGAPTPTAALHARCWKQTFDPVLAECGRSAGTRPEPFDAEHDNLSHVDGRDVQRLGLSGKPAPAPAELRSAGADMVVADLAEMVG